MTKTETQRLRHLTAALTGLGFTVEEVEKLRKISNTLRQVSARGKPTETTAPSCWLNLLSAET